MKATINWEYRKRKTDGRLVLAVQVVKGSEVIDIETFLVGPGRKERKEAADYIRRNKFMYN